MGVLHTLIRVAVGTAGVLGLTDIKMNVNPKTAHLMTYGKCVYDCRFCTQARSSSSNEKLLSRISWPEFEENVVFRALSQNQDDFKRVCLQVVRSDEGPDHTHHVKNIKRHCKIPLSVDLKADGIESVRNTFSAGADCVGLPIDCASSTIYPDVKEGTFSSQLQLIEQAASEYPKRISTHIMVGLGETEEDCVVLLKRLKEASVTAGLFAFTPIKGTALESKGRPPIEVYRRIQIARYLIYRRFELDFSFDKNGSITGYGYPPDELKDLIDPSAFQTTGCLDCNRPYYNERPGGAMYNYPKEPSQSEHRKALKEALVDREANCE
jgi:biotin synthase